MDSGAEDGGVVLVTLFCARHVAQQYQATTLEYGLKGTTAKQLSISCISFAQSMPKSSAASSSSLSEHVAEDAAVSVETSVAACDSSESERSASSSGSISTIS